MNVDKIVEPILGKKPSPLDIIEFKAPVAYGSEKAVFRDIVLPIKDIREYYREEYEWWLEHPEEPVKKIKESIEEKLSILTGIPKGAIKEFFEIKTGPIKKEDLEKADAISIPFIVEFKKPTDLITLKDIAFILETVYEEMREPERREEEMLEYIGKAKEKLSEALKL